MTQEHFEGIVLRGPEFEPVTGRVVVEAGRIESVEETATDSTDIVIPAFVNAHTHVGDSIAKEAGAGLTLEELVAPPDGLKHRLLEAASEADLVEGMRRSLRYMERSGTATFLEFREGGVAGVRQLQAAAEELAIEPVVFGRGSIEAMRVGDGYGASGAHDGDFSRERTATAEAGKPFGIHAGELEASDINPALDLNPDFLVHMVHAERLHLERVADREVPVVVCPRSNLVTGVGRPDIDELAAYTSVALGTDNVMLNSPSMFREMEFAAKLSNRSAPEVLAMATRNGAEIVGSDAGLIEAGRPARLVVLDGDSDNLCGAQDWVRAVVRRASVDDVTAVYLG